MKFIISKSKIAELIIVTTLFTSIVSCKKECEDVEGNLTSEEQSWLSYAGGEMLVFQRDTTLIDTFWVGNRISYYNSGYIESEDHCQHHQQTVEFSISGHMSTAFGLSVSHNNQWVDGYAHIGTGSVSFEFANFSPQDNILIHGHTVNSVYIMTRDTTNFSSPNIWRIYYTKLNGILRYDFTQGQQWERIN